VGKVERAIEIELSRILSKIHPKKLVGFLLLVEKEQGRCWGKPSKPLGLGNPPAWGNQIKKKKNC
jgi:hypothetical protein